MFMFRNVKFNVSCKTSVACVLFPLDQTRYITSQTVLKSSKCRIDGTVEPDLKDHPIAIDNTVVLDLKRHSIGC